MIAIRVTNLEELALARRPGAPVRSAAVAGDDERPIGRDAGIDRVAVVDLDAHHGNGTAAIFYDRADVLYGSVHVDPGAGWFPHVVGYADETGTGEGLGRTLNVPLPEGTGDGPWLDAVARLSDWVTEAGCELLTARDRSLVVVPA